MLVIVIESIMPSYDDSIRTKKGCDIMHSGLCGGEFMAKRVGKER